MRLVVSLDDRTSLRRFCDSSAREPTPECTSSGRVRHAPAQRARRGGADGHAGECDTDSIGKNEEQAGLWVEHRRRKPRTVHTDEFDRRDGRAAVGTLGRGPPGVLPKRKGIWHMQEKEWPTPDALGGTGQNRLAGESHRDRLHSAPRHDPACPNRGVTTPQLCPQRSLARDVNRVMPKRPIASQNHPVVATAAQARAGSLSSAQIS